MNALVALDQYGAVRFAATHASESESAGPNVKSAVLVTTVSVNNSEPSPDSLTIYFQKNSIGTCRRGENPKDNAQALWDRLKKIYKEQGVADQDPYSITLNAKGGPAKPRKPAKPPVLETYSAVDIMLMASTSGNHTYQDRAERIREIIARRKELAKSSLPCGLDFYVVDDWVKMQKWNENENKFMKEIEDQYNKGNFLTTTFIPRKDSLPAYGIDLQTREALLSTVRTFMLIGYSEYRPTDAYVSVLYKGKWHSIFDDDSISKKTLTLIHQFNIVQAAPPQTQPLTPTISVGAR